MMLAQGYNFYIEVLIECMYKSLINITDTYILWTNTTNYAMK